METVTHTSMFPYREELIIEITGKDANGEVVVRTYQFAYDEEQPKTVRPKGEIPTRHESIVERALGEHDYKLR